MRYAPSTRQVVVFLAVARHLKFLAAAEELNMSQPAVTAQIGELERNLGLHLFHRTKREVALTPEGRDLLPGMARIAETLEAIVEASEELGTGRRGKVRIAALPSVAASILPGSIAGFRAARPGIRIAVADVVAEDILAMVKAGEADFGIGPRTSADHAVAGEPFMTDELCAFLPGDHPLAREEAPSLRRCAGFPQIVTMPPEPSTLVIVPLPSASTSAIGKPSRARPGTSLRPRSAK